MQMIKDDALEEQYGFKPYYCDARRDGWLLNYDVVCGDDGRMGARLYLIDDQGVEFLAEMRYFPSFLVKAVDYEAVEDYLRRKYGGDVHMARVVGRIDFKEYNHLNKAPTEYLEVQVRTETGFNTMVRELKRIAARNKVRSNGSEGFDFDVKRVMSAEEGIVSICEYDIPAEVRVANVLGIRCGKWYVFWYDGEKYMIERSERIVFPDLRILAFDIETSKKPLKFPSADYDEVMMISVKTESKGYLIVNRQLVSKDIKRFEYSPKDDMQCVFEAVNEHNEEGVLVAFAEIVQKHRPHLMSTFNGSGFDFPFVEKRMQKYGICLKETMGFECKDGYYTSPFIVHLDCYKWVKRDSYLPAGSQGLKAVTKAKLGYFPDEVDPEEMVDLAIADPDRMASYSVSDAVATYFLYVKYVQPHVFSLCSLIPLSPTSAICQGSGTLCEALLISEAVEYGVIVPDKRVESKYQEYEGYIAENVTYVGGHVECVRAGLFRSDFSYDFDVNKKFIEDVGRSIDEMLAEYKDEEDFEVMKMNVMKNLEENTGKIRREGRIYHLDVGAMYPNIILTNKLQPVSIVNDDVCIRCDFSDEANGCRKKMEWTLKAEYIPVRKDEVERIRIQCIKDGKNDEEELVRRVKEYSKKSYKRSKVKVCDTRSSVVCQREIPFYVETVRKFRDRRYTYKKLHSKALRDAEGAMTEEERRHALKSAVVYSSLQVAHKCVLNSFYGYVMRKGSRWYSMEMAAIVCNVGGNVIRKAKEVVEMIGMSLELDTDGIWCVVPSTLMSTYVFRSGRKMSLLSSVLNYFVCKGFTNEMYQELRDGEYVRRSENSIFFEIDGPYRAMLLPASTEESKVLKKRYAIINDDNSVAELKGFEVKRRGELEIVKKFQEELFLHFLDGSTLTECYGSLAEVCGYWLDILKSRGEYLDDETILELLSESRSMSKEYEEYEGKKSNITTTALRMSEMLGKNVLEEKLKCEYVIAVYPEGKSVAERTIPVIVFRSCEKEKYLGRWLGRRYGGNIRAIIDWGYYKQRLESVILRMVVLPAISQGIKNPLSDVNVPEWAVKKGVLFDFDFVKVRDIEDIGSKKSVVECMNDVVNGNVVKENEGYKQIANDGERYTEIVTANNSKCEGVIEYFQRMRAEWMDGVRSFLHKGDIVRVNATNDGFLDVFYANKHEAERKELVRYIYIEINGKQFFEGSERVKIVKRFLSDGEQMDVGMLMLNENEFRNNYALYKKFLSHFSIKRVFEEEVPVLYGNMKECDGGKMRYTLLSGFMHDGRVVYLIGKEEDNFMILNGDDALKKYLLGCVGRWQVFVIGSDDVCKVGLRKMLVKRHVVERVFGFGLCIGGYERKCEERKKKHLEIGVEMDMIFAASEYTKVPVMNVDEELLELLFYKELKNEEVICDGYGTEENVMENALNEKFKAGLYREYVVEMECVGAMVLAILEHNEYLGEEGLYDGVKRKDFVVLQRLLKKIVLDCARGDQGAKVIVQGIEIWISRRSKIISGDLRGVCKLLKRRYVMNLVKRLCDDEYGVVLVAGQTIFVNTGKTSQKSAIDFFEHMRNKVTSIEGYEMMKIKICRMFERLILVNPNMYFFVSEGEYVGFSESNVPKSFLKMIFGDQEIDSEMVYRLVTRVPAESSRVMIEILAHIQGMQWMITNCCKLLRISEFEEKMQTRARIMVICPVCGFESTMKSRCVRCYRAYAPDVILEECMRYAKNLLKLELCGDSYCARCGAVKERRLSDACKCGGSFRKEKNIERLDEVRKIANSKVIDEMYDGIVKHFAK
ncbi:DNA polymerase epsilon [Ordospora colligata OC4]|uniref:DNA polymerase epsilon catalytic subunit n=1 Tax=Ordospora colligata OC4 TaxID=1354746 RepID=A0A0B2UL13_9MICR|nr:DNA polymerase epsilon [Ordospora colligata OC4]KHN69707.1 DNA polymerase epsilon [Ordospora colligata OC4]